MAETAALKRVGSGKMRPSTSSPNLSAAAQSTSPDETNDSPDSLAEEVIKGSNFELKPVPLQLAPMITTAPTQTSRCAVFWDYENCAPPTSYPGFLLVENIRRAIHNFGYITQFKAYLQINEKSKTTLRSELQSSGVSLTDCPHNGRKDAADKMILVDMMAFALDNPPPATIVLISGDRDFVYALSTLRNRRYNIVLIVPNKGASIILRSQANAVLEWRYDVLNNDVIQVLQAQKESQKEALRESKKQNLSNISLSGSATDLAQTASGNGEKVKITPSTSLTNLAMNLLADESASAPTTGSSGGSASSTGTPFSSNTPATGMKKTKEKKESPLRESTSLKLDIKKTHTSDIANDEDNAFLISPQAPGFFELLVEVLERFRLEGDVRPKRKKVSEELLKRNPLICQRAGLSGIDDYIEMAARQNIVAVGGTGKQAWMAMNEDLITKF